MEAVEIRLASETIPAVRVLGMTGREGLTQLYEFEVTFSSADGVEPQDYTPAEWLGEPVEIHFVRSASVLRRTRGIVCAVHVAPAERGTRARYRVRVVPPLWAAAQIRRSRIFQDCTVPQIVAQVARSSSLALSARLRGSYPQREYTVQYEETDLAFICRLMEEEGIGFFFQFDPSGDAVVAFDENQGFRVSAAHDPILFNANPSLSSGEPSISQLESELCSVPAGVVLVDYNWRNPSLDLESECDVSGGTLGAVVTSLEHFREPQAGARLANIRAQEIAVQARLLRATSNVPTLGAGDVLRIDGCPDAAFDGQYVVLQASHSVEHTFVASGAGGRPYSNALVLMPLSVPYRPPRRTPKPRIDGCTYATIDGPGLGVPAPVDDQGRYKVVLPFDPDPATGGRASRWVRRAQPLSGPGHGMHFPLREGAEVILSYVHGDPDRPIIVGAVPNPQTPGPVAKTNATQSIISTLSGIRVTMEDDA